MTGTKRARRQPRCRSICLFGSRLTRFLNFLSIFDNLGYHRLARKNHSAKFMLGDVLFCHLRLARMRAGIANAIGRNETMNKQIVRQNALLSLLLMLALWLGALPVAGQDVAVVSDITGGSSVFVFRTSAKAATKRFTVQERSSRSKAQRIEGGKKITRQYVTLAKAAPRRLRLEAVAPDDPRLPKIPTMPRDQASKLFAGVGEYYIDKENSVEAANFFREAYGLDAQNSVAKNGLSEALALRGNEMLAKDKTDEAKKFFDESLQFNPNNGVAYFGLGEL